MPTKLTKTRLEKILRDKLHLNDPVFRLEVYGNRINGLVISDSFKRKGDSQRQEMIWDALTGALGPDSVKLVGMILAYTPEEWNLDSDRVVAAGKVKAR